MNRKTRLERLINEKQRLLNLLGYVANCDLIYKKLDKIETRINKITTR